MKTEITHQIGDRVKVLHNIPLGNLIGTVKAIHQRPKHDVYEVELDGGGTDSLYGFQLERITDTPRTDAITQPGDWTHAELPRQMEVELYEAAKIIRRLLSYADRTAENHPRAVTSAGQNARVRAGMWLAQYERENANNPKVMAPKSQREAAGTDDEKPYGQAENAAFLPPGGAEVSKANVEGAMP